MGIRVEHHDDHTVLVCRGRLDVAASRELREAVGRCLSAGPRILVLDMAGVEIADTSVIGALLACHGEAKAAGGDVRLARVSGRVNALLAQVDAGKRLVAYVSVEDATKGAA